MIIKSMPGRNGSRPLHAHTGRSPLRHRARRSAIALGLGIVFGSSALFGADPVVPAAPVEPTTSAPAASNAATQDAPVIPGFGPNEGLPNNPFNPGDFPQMELIPNGMTPLQPNSLLPDQSLGGAQPLVPQADKPVDLKSLKYTISKFNVKYGLPKQATLPKLPTAKSLADTPVVLGEAPASAGRETSLRDDLDSSGQRYGGLVGPGAGVRDIPIVLSQVKAPETFSGDALQAIYTSLVGQLNKKGIYGVFVIVDPDQINPSTGEDLRKGSTELNLLVYASEVRQVRTIVKPVAKWPFKAPSTSLDDPKSRKDHRAFAVASVHQGQARFPAPARRLAGVPGPDQPFPRTPRRRGGDGFR